MSHTLTASGKNTRRALVLAQVRTAKYSRESDQKKLECALRGEQDTVLQRVIVRYINPNYAWETLCVLAVYSEKLKVARSAFARLAEISDFTERRNTYELVSTSSRHPSIKQTAAERFRALAH